MSSAIFPTLEGLSWNVSKTPQFSTRIQTATSGREVRIANRTYPMYSFKMNYEVLRDNRNTNIPASPRDELKTLLAFFLKRRGSFESFLYDDLTDNAVIGQGFGVGNGSTTSFQLARAYGIVDDGFAEPVENINGAPTICADGVLVTGGYSISTTGVVTFTTAPLSGVELTWTGEFYYRVRFNMDASEFNQFMYDLWELKKCELYGAVMNKI